MKLAERKFEDREACEGAIMAQGLIGKYRPQYIVTSTEAYFYAKKHACITCGNDLHAGDDLECTACEMDRSHRNLWGSAHP